MAEKTQRKAADQEQPYLEIINPGARNGRIRHVLFDFDGTLSLIREGWQQVMGQMMVEALLSTAGDDDVDQLPALAAGIVEATTGQATIRQMEQLAQAIAARGGSPHSAKAYKALFLRYLTERIDSRLEALARGEISVQSLLVAGSEAILAALHERGMVCSLASGTDHHAVLHEIEMLGISAYFNGRVYGARDDELHLSKGEVIRRILQQSQLHGSELAVIGDGVVEIVEAKAAGALAIGVASNEVTRQGVDGRKRETLIAAGADAIIPDFSQLDVLLAYLLGEPKENEAYV